MPYIKSKSHNENVALIEAATDEEITKKSEDFLEGQRHPGRAVAESGAVPGEWKVSYQDGLISIAML